MEGSYQWKSRRRWRLYLCLTWLGILWMPGTAILKLKKGRTHCRDAGDSIKPRIGGTVDCFVELELWNFALSPFCFSAFLSACMAPEEAPQPSSLHDLPALGNTIYIGITNWAYNHPSTLSNQPCQGGTSDTIRQQWHTPWEGGGGLREEGIHRIPKNQTCCYIVDSDS